MKRNKSRKLKKGRIIILLIIIIVVILLCITLFSTKQIKLKNDKFTFEYGEIVELDKSNIIDTKDEDIINSISINQSKLNYITDNEYPEVGKYQLEVKYEVKNKKFSSLITVEIIDTTKPTFTKFTDNIEISIGTVEVDYSKYFEAIDLSSVVLSYDAPEVDYEKTGEYKLVVSATDSSNNKISKEATVKIVKKNSGIPNNSNKDVHEDSLYYKNGILVVNKKHPLPLNYAPGENQTAGDAVRKIISDMQALGLDISSSYSGYRSYSYQNTLYNNYVASHGQVKADTFSARPGYSEHQTGLAFDLKHSDGTLATKKTEATWIAENAHLYGFIVRYKEGKEDITGYMAESWHLRYIGSKAKDIYESGKTLEEYLGIKGGSY